MKIKQRKKPGRKPGKVKKKASKKSVLAAPTRIIKVRWDQSIPEDVAADPSSQVIVDYGSRTPRAVGRPRYVEDIFGVPPI